MADVAPGPLTQERIKELAKRLRDPVRGVSTVDVLEAADALDLLARVAERCGKKRVPDQTVYDVKLPADDEIDRYVCGAVNAERRAILALLVAAGQKET